MWDVLKLKKLMGRDAASHIPMLIYYIYTDFSRQFVYPFSLSLFPSNVYNIKCYDLLVQFFMQHISEIIVVIRMHTFT